MEDLIRQELVNFLYKVEKRIISNELEENCETSNKLYVIVKWTTYLF